MSGVRRKWAQLRIRVKRSSAPKAKTSPRIDAFRFVALLANQTEMNRIFVALIISVVSTGILFIMAAMSGGVCHCMDAMFNLFPYGTIIEMRTSWNDTGLLLTFVQFPIYTILVLITPTKRWKVVVVIVLLVIHVVFAVWGLRVHKGSRYFISDNQVTSGTSEVWIRITSKEF